MKTNELMVDPKEFGLEENKALELTSGLTTILTERETLRNAYLDVIDLEITEENLKTFKELRLKIVKNRTQGIEKWHKANKEFFLTGGRFVDAVKNKEVFENERMENSLLEKEKHFENLEKARLKAIHEERVSKLIPFNYEIGNIDFSAMDENMFNAILLGAETNHKDKLEAERLAEEQRLEALRIEAEEKEKQRVEMDRLKVEKAKADAELSKQKRLADELAAELKAKTEAELIEKQRIDDENKAKELAEKKAAKAPDKYKMKAWLNELELFPIDLKSKESNDKATDIMTKFSGFKKWALDQIETI